MLNEDLIYEAHAILLNHIHYFEKEREKYMADDCLDAALRADAMASAYNIAWDILWYAIIGDEEHLKWYDYDVD